MLLRIAGLLPYLAMVFVNAFVDLGHKIVIQNTIFKVYAGQQLIELTAIVNALILLPFILFLTPAGFCSDRFPRHRVMQFSAWVAVALTLLITFCYYQGLFWPAFALTFLLALQSAFYSPAKYGYIKGLVGKQNLAAGNGLVQAVTTVAILAGIFAFTLMFEHYLHGVEFTGSTDILPAIAMLGWVLVGCSVIELGLAYRLPRCDNGDAALKFDWPSYRRGRSLQQTLRAVHAREAIFLSIIGLAIFWSISQVMIAAFPAYAKETLGILDTRLVQGAMACAGIGIVIGSVIAGRVSARHIETGLVPVGSIGIAVCLSLIPVLDGMLAQALNFLLWGILGGLLIIPLNALIQFHAGEPQLGRILAGNNLIQNVLMLSFLGLTVLFSRIGLDSLDLFRLLMLVAIIATFYTVWKLPQSMLRMLVTFVIGRRYRLQVLGFEQIPEQGGVLLLGNHISWIDWAIVQMASPRPVRFVMERGIYQRWYLRGFLDLFRVIPISTGSSKNALEAITECLNRGDVVCLFPEGTISRSGQLSTFQRGFEKAAAGARGIILPFYLRGLWGSWFSRSSARLRILRRGGVRRDLIVAFGAPLPMSTPAHAVKSAVAELSITAWQQHTQQLPSLAAAWLDSTTRMRSRLAVADSLGEGLSYRRFAAATLCFSARMRRLSREQNIGLLLPTSSAGAIANMAVLLAGKTVVNLNFTASREALQAAIRRAGIDSIYTSRRFIGKLEDKGFALDAMRGDASVYYLEDLKAEIPNSALLARLLLISVLPAWLLKPLLTRRVAVDAPAAILFSSGSEGEPKGVMLSHRNIMANVQQISDVLNTREDDVVMASLPLFHAFGLTVTTFMPLIEGMPMICHPDPTDAVNIGKAVARHQATILCGTSTFLRLYTLNRRLQPLMFDSLRVVVAGAERLKPEVREAFTLKFNKPVYEGYGATETTPVASVNLPDQLDTRYWQVQVGSKPGTVGMPLPGSSFRIVDPETLASLAPGEDGLILIGGTQVMLGYLEDEERTDAAITEIDGQRWYRTGDKGHLDEDGFLTIVDRYSRFAKIGGEMVSLTAVEDQVRQALAQAELEAVAVNLPDDKKGERIVLLTTSDFTLETLKAAMLERQCNPLMIPSEVVAVAAIPMLGSGKTDFGAARQLASSAPEAG